ncbi:MAG: ABC transporter ATP-binding protein [Gammaproteobacteria bacterium]
MTDLLTARDLAVTIADTRVCHGLNLRIRSGERWAILGRNGSGKTTLLHTLAGLRPAQGGDIFLKGKRLQAWQPRRRARQVGTLLQHYDDPFPTTVLETALIGRHPHLQRWEWEDGHDVAKAREALDAVDLAGYDKRSVATLSGGERRRLAIATLLAQNPQLMLLDEPTSHLDLFHQLHALRLLTKLADQDNRALIMVLHDITSAVRHCDHALLLFGEGRVLAGPVTEIVNEANLARLYGHPIRCLAGPDGQVWTPAYGDP